MRLRNTDTCTCTCKAIYTCRSIVTLHIYCIQNINVLCLSAAEGNGTIPTEENSSDPTEMMMNETRNVSSEILPRLYGVIAASGLITVVVCTLICTIIILVHCFK